MSDEVDYYALPAMPDQPSVKLRGQMDEPARRVLHAWVECAQQRGEKIGALASALFYAVAVLEDVAKAEQPQEGSRVLEAITAGIKALRGEPSDMRRQLEALREALSDLLQSADASWEEHHLGHDWAEYCRRARAALAASATTKESIG